MGNDIQTPEPQKSQWFDHKFSITDWVVNIVQASLISLNATGSATAIGTAAVFVWLLGSGALLLPSLHVLWEYVSGRTPRHRLDISQTLIGCAMFIGIAILWYAHPQELSVMVNQASSSPVRVFGVLAAAFLLGSAICTVLSFVSYGKTASHQSVSVQPMPNDEKQQLESQIAALKEQVRDSPEAAKLTIENLGLKERQAHLARSLADAQQMLTQEQRAVEKAKQEHDKLADENAQLSRKAEEIRQGNAAISKMFESASLYNVIFKDFAARLALSKADAPLKRVVLEHWIQQFEQLSNEKISSDAERDAWIKRVDEQKKMAHDSLIAFFNRSVIDGRFFNPKYQKLLTVGKKFENKYDDQHNIKLNEVGSLIEILNKELATLPK